VFGQIGLKPNLIKDLSREQILEQFEPFKSGNVRVIKKGDYKTQKVGKIVLEIRHVEMVGNCYQVTLQDIVGEEIQATFHSDCKESFSKQIRRGKILVLQNVRAIVINITNIGCDIYFESSEHIFDCES